MAHSVARVVAVLTIGAVAACGGSSAGGSGGQAKGASSSPAAPAPSATPSITGPQPPSATTLRTALLTVQDFPTGWKTTPVTDSKSKASGDCGDKLEAFDKAHPDSKIKAEADFARQSDEIDEELQAYSNRPDLQAQFAEYAGIIRGCSTLTVQADKEKVKLAVSELSFPKLGDESFAYAATGKIQGIEFELNQVIVRRGSVLVQLTQSSVFSGDVDLLTTTATKALAKLDKVVPVD
jgi:hypothetical protein